jgi:hypothetical protein
VSDSQHPEIDSSQVADLQGQLNDASAKLAQVQAQLAAAQGRAGTGTAASGPGMPAAGTVPVVTVNGQAVPLGDGHQLNDIVAALRAGHGTGGAGTPTIIVNGQQVGSGQPVNLAAMFNPQQLAKIQAGLASLQSTHPEYAQNLASMFSGAAGAQAGVPYGDTTYSSDDTSGSSGGSSYPTPTSVAPIADPPRPVPLVYRLATFDLSIVEIFVLFMVGVAPIALWMSVPASAPFAWVAVSLAIIGYRGHKYIGRIGMLKWGKVATVTGTDLKGVGSYYSGTTYQNMRMRQAHGWTAETHWYSGPGYHTKINYTLDSYQGVFSLHGLEYDNGVILAHSKHPKRAMCVSGFPYVVTPTADGRWPGKLTAWLWGGIVATLAIEVCVFYLTYLSVTSHWF